MRLIGRSVADVQFPRMLRVRRIPDGTVTTAQASESFRRHDREVVLLRLETGEHALALNSESPRWRWPEAADEGFVVMLYRANGERSASREMRRLLDPRRRDALYKAELLAA